MSGGSYDYIFVKDIGGLYEHIHDVRDMAERLAGLGYAPDAAAETTELLLTLRQTEVYVGAIQRRLEGVWRAVEWWDSGDSGEEDLKEALTEYRKNIMSPKVPV